MIYCRNHNLFIVYLNVLKQKDFNNLKIHNLNLNLKFII